MRATFDELAISLGNVRRTFYKLTTPGPAPIASEALQRIAALYAIEKDVRGRSVEERRLVRRQKSRPLIDALEPWLRTKLGLISQKGRRGHPLRPVALEGLTRFIDDGRIEFDLADVLTRMVNGHPNRVTDALLSWAYRKQDLRAVA